MRVNVYVPDELAASVKDSLPGINVSAVLQAGLRSALGCQHHRVVCAECAHPVDRAELREHELGKFITDVHWALTELVDRDGTAEGAARVVLDLARRHQIKAAEHLVAPRPPRARRRSTAA